MQHKTDIAIKLHKNSRNIPYLMFEDDRIFFGRLELRQLEKSNIFWITTIKFQGFSRIRRKMDQKLADWKARTYQQQVRLFLFNLILQGSRR